MGHQIYFYLTPSDTELLETSIRARVELVIIRRRATSPTPEQLPSLNSQLGGETIWDLFLTRAIDLQHVVMDYVSMQRYWTIEYEASPVVQFSGSVLEGEKLYRGRVYYTDGFYGPDGQWVLKSEEFRKWAKVVLATIKKSLKPLEPGKRFTDYIGEDAAKWHAAGGKLVQM